MLILILIQIEIEHTNSEDITIDRKNSLSVEALLILIPILILIQIEQKGTKRNKKDNIYHSSLQAIQRFKITRVHKYALTKVKNPRIEHINSEDMGKTI